MSETLIKIVSLAELEANAIPAGKALLDCFQASLGDETDFGIEALHTSYHSVDLLSAGYRLLCDQPEIMRRMLKGYWDNDTNHLETTDAAAKLAIRGHIRRGFGIAGLIGTTPELSPLDNQLRLKDRAYLADATSQMRSDQVNSILFGHTCEPSGIAAPLFADQMSAADIIAVFPDIEIEKPWGKSDLGLWFLWLRQHRISLFHGGYNLVGPESAEEFRSGLARFCGSPQSSNRAALLDIFNNAKTRAEHIAHDPDLLHIIKPFIAQEDHATAITLVPELTGQIRATLQQL
jgi:hypothetical protein